MTRPGRPGPANLTGKSSTKNTSRNRMHSAAAPAVGLIDTGAILAIVESGDHWHTACLEALRFVRIPLLTTEAVLNEAFHLTGKNPHTIANTWGLVRSSALPGHPLPAS